MKKFILLSVIVIALASCGSNADTTAATAADSVATGATGSTVTVTVDSVKADSTKK